MPQTVGISPKLIAAALTTLIVALLNRFALELDPGVEVALNVLFTALATYWAPPGQVVQPAPEVGVGSDARLSDEALAEIPPAP